MPTPLTILHDRANGAPPAAVNPAERGNDVPSGAGEGPEGGCDLTWDAEGGDQRELPPALKPLPVEVIRSPNRHKTIGARLTGGGLQVRIPEWMSETDEDEAVESFRRKFDQRRRCWEVNLGARARDLAAQLGLPEAASVRWSTRQRRRMGSCNMVTGEILISHRLADVPPWVLDYVIVHELAHLRVPEHSADFHALVARYPLAERAKGYLEAFTTWAAERPDPDPIH